MPEVIIPAEQAEALGRVLTEEVIDYDVVLNFSGTVTVRANPGGAVVVKQDGGVVRYEDIEVGGTYTFYSEVYDVTVRDTVHSSYDGTPLRMFTGKEVKVLSQIQEGDADLSAMYEVQVLPNGPRFVVHGEEINGWDRASGQFYGPSGTWGDVG